MSLYSLESTERYRPILYLYGYIGGVITASLGVLVKPLGTPVQVREETKKQPYCHWFAKASVTEMQAMMI